MAGSWAPNSRADRKLVTPASDYDPRPHQTQCDNLGLPYQSDLQDGTLPDPLRRNCCA